MIALGRHSIIIANAAEVMLWISRQYSISLLEYLDATGFTCRIGGRRVFAKSAGEADR